MATEQVHGSEAQDFSYLDIEDFRQKYIPEGDAAKAIFFVGGIHCEKCVRKLEGLAESTPGLRQFRVEMGKKLVHVEFDPLEMPLSRVAGLIAEKGFDPIPLEKDSDFAKHEREEGRRALIRLAVAGACAGNIMTFSFATYFGADWRLFAWLSFALYLPVVTFVAWPFYTGAWRAFRQRQISIDLPMAVASFAGFVFSTAGLVRGQPQNIYFDSLSGFLFLILCARWMQRRLQSHFLSMDKMTEGMALDRVRVMQKSGWEWRPLDRLRYHDKIIVNAGECLAADAELISQRAYFSLAWITGEARPQVFTKGSIVPAGSRLVSKGAIARVSVPFAETTFGKVLDQVQRFSLARSPAVLLSDRWAQRLLTTVFLIAGIFLIFYWGISPEEAIRRSLALVVLACPCAMAFGTPLALAVSLKKSRKAGLILRNADVFEKAAGVRTIFFDKTGTLTETDLTLSASSAVSDYQKSIVLGLENQSFHPIAFGFRKAFSGIAPLQMEGLKETPGVGVSGTVGGQVYELRRSANGSLGPACALYENSQCIAEFQFEIALKPNCREALERLRGMGYELRLLSGDCTESVYDLGRKLGFQNEEIFAELSPQEKERAIAKAHNSMMVGDGINDSLALLKADVSVATSGGVATALKSASVYMTGPDLEGIVSLFRLSREAFALIRQNLTISIVYNIAGGTLALLGFINPFVAAVLMPISSGFILLTTFLRSRE